MLSGLDYGNWGANALFLSRSIPLHAMLTSCGHEMRTGTDYDLNGLNRGGTPFTIWQYTISGEGALDYEGRQYRIKQGEAMMIHVPQNHRYYLPPDSPSWEFIYVSIHGREAMRLWLEFEQAQGPVAKFAEDSNTVSAVCELLQMGRMKAFTNPFIVSSLCYKILMACFQDLAPYGTAGGQERALLRKVTDFCLAHIQEEITVEDMAGIAGYSKFHFSRIFKERAGMAPAEFLRDLRVKTAISLLQMERLNVKEIALRCGFPDESYFCKVFRKSQGLSPAEFRRGENPGNS